MTLEEAPGPSAAATAPPEAERLEYTTPKSSNPFRTQQISESATFHSKLPTLFPAPDIHSPYKTLNRILDDLKYTVPYRNVHPGSSLLRSRPIEYSVNLSRIAAKKPKCATITINNDVAYAPTIETAGVDSEGNLVPQSCEDQDTVAPFTLTVIRGLVVCDNDIHHFRLATIDSATNPFATTIDKHEYHLVDPSDISRTEAKVLDTHSSSFIDDAMFRSASASTRHVLRATIFKSEFTSDDLWPLLNEEVIANRYEQGAKRHPDLNLSPNAVPTSVHCIHTLLKVLRGPILLPPGDPIKTISLTKTSLDTQLDVDLLTSRLGFVTAGEDVVPPNLANNLQLRESYIRKSIELIYVGANIDQLPNPIGQQYSFSDNLSVVYRAINESDRHVNVTFASSHISNQLPFFTNLSATTYFQDELLIRCYENTLKSDSRNRLHYVDSLRSIINFKRGQSGLSNQKLQSYFNHLVQSGRSIGYEEYCNALRVIGIDRPNDNLTDDDIIAVYKAQYQEDPRNYSYFNKHLKAIANARDSTTLHNYIKNEVLPLNIAMDDLGIEEITEDEVVITAYEFKLDDLLQSNGFNSTASEIILLNRSLLSVAVNRKSYLLMSYYERKIDTSKPGVSVRDALVLLDLEDVKYGDVEIITSFQNRIAKATDVEDIRKLRAALRALAESRDLAILASFLHSGRVDVLLLPAENWPSGLDNIGNTCYLNSLLQYYFCIKPLRQMVLDFPKNATGLEEVSERKIGGRKVELLEVHRSHQFVYHLQKLFFDMIHTNKRCVAPSKELAYLAFLPLSQPVGFGTNDSNAVSKLDESAGVGQGDELEPIMIESRTPSPPLLPTPNSTAMSDDEMLGVKEAGTILPILDEIDSTIEVGRQQDVTECIENVTFQLETALEPESLEEDGEQFDLIKKLFYGKTQQTLTPMHKSGEQRISTERFFSLIINVSDHPKDIYDSLDNYFSEDIVNLEDGQVKKSLTVAKLPEVLQFHVQRVLFDREKLMAYKSIEHIPFSERIYLDRYLETQDPEILKKREEVFQWRSEVRHIHELRNKILTPDPNSKLSIIDALVTTKKYLETKVVPSSSVAVNPVTILNLQVHIDELKGKIEAFDAKLEELTSKISTQFTDYTKVGYSIFAIFIHRGEASYGHYWVYIKDPHQGIFRKYNDEMVTEVPSSEVFNFVKENTATPYYIVYVKDSLEKDYVEPLKRIIE